MARRALLLPLLVLAACGGSAPADTPPVTVYAAASLRDAFPGIDRSATYNFAGSGQLKTQIERGAPADVFASASPKEPQALFAAGRCTRPMAFATNTLVLLVPAANPAGIESVESLARGPRRRLAIGAETVPIGAYTRKLLDRLGLDLSRHTVSSEPNVAGITAKVALGSADAGFAYATDARSAGDRVRAIALPERAQPTVSYEICAVRDSAAAQAFIAKVTGEAGRRVLVAHGFGVP